MSDDIIMHGEINNSTMRDDFDNVTILVVDDQDDEDEAIYNRQFERIRKIPRIDNITEIIVEHIRLGDLVHDYCEKRLKVSRLIRAATISKDGFIAKPSPGARITVQVSQLKKKIEDTCSSKIVYRDLFNQ